MRILSTFFFCTLCAFQANAQKLQKITPINHKPAKDQESVVKEEIAKFLEELRKNPKHQTKYIVRRGNLSSCNSIHAIAFQLRAYTVLYSVREDRTADNATTFILRAR